MQIVLIILCNTLTKGDLSHERKRFKEKSNGYEEEANGQEERYEEDRNEKKRIIK